MTLPLTTTQLAFTRKVEVGDYDDPENDETTVGTVAGVVSGGAGRGVYVNGTMEVVDAVANVNPIDAQPGDQATDLTSGYTYRVLSVQQRYELSTAHVNIALRRVRGAA